MSSAGLSWSIAPQPPRVGPATLSLSLTDAASRPIVGARWQIEGQMTHPGMRPVVLNVAAVVDGSYAGQFSFTMAGDWVLVVRADWADGQWLERSLPLRVEP